MFKKSITAVFTVMLLITAVFQSLGAEEITGRVVMEKVENRFTGHDRVADMTMTLIKSSSRRRVMKDTDGIVEKPDISFVMGADYTLFENLYLNLQWAGKYIFDYEKGIEEDEMENRLVLSCYDTFFDEELKLGLTGMIYRLKDMDYMIKPYIEYSAADGVSIETGSYLFGGKEQSMFGEFSGNSSVFLKISYYF